MARLHKLTRCQRSLELVSSLQRQQAAGLEGSELQCAGRGSHLGNFGNSSSAHDMTKWRIVRGRVQEEIPNCSGHVGMLDEVVVCGWSGLDGGGGWW